LKIILIVFYKSSQKIVHILAGHFVKAQKTARNSTFSSVRSKRTPCLMMFRENKR